MYRRGDGTHFLSPPYCAEHLAPVGWRVGDQDIEVIEHVAVAHG
jgi:hypothetical protein